MNPPPGYILDPANPGWYYDPTGDVSQLSAWWQQPPPGYVADPTNPGWYYDPSADVSQLAAWWHDATIQPQPDAFTWGRPDLVAGVTGCPRANIERMWPLVFTALTLQGQATRASCAAAIGTIAIETASTFLPVEEAFWLSPAARLAYYLDLTQHAEYSGGPQYHGRGPIQLTHDYNYRAAGEAIGQDLLAQPERVLEPEIGAQVFGWYWAQRDIQTPANAHDWAEVRRRVQGGTAGLPRLIQIAAELLQ